MSIKVSLTALISKKVICMHKNYIGYKADQLLNDDRFVQWLLSPTAEEDLFWDELKQKDKELAEEIDIARSFIGHLRRDIKHPDFSSIDEIVLWNRINTENRKDKLQKKTISVIKTLVGVAAVVFLCLFVVQEYYFSDKDVDYQAILNTTEPIFNSTGEIELVLSGNKKIAIQEKESQVEYNHKGEINVNSQKVATEIEEKDNTKIFNQLIVPYGRRSSLTFSDGTKIWVNSGSKVIYPVSFEKKKREIYVEGEVYLDVTHDTSWPFVVRTQQVDVKVLGTSFNVSAYKDDSNMQVTLVEGKVEVNTNKKSTEVLLPNQQFDYDDQTHEIKVQVVDVNNYTAWRNGYYLFEKQPLEIVFKKLSRYYGVQIEWDEIVGKLTCSGKLDLRDNLNDVLDNLKNAASNQIVYSGEKIKISTNS